MHLQESRWRKDASLCRNNLAELYQKKDVHRQSEWTNRNQGSTYDILPYCFVTTIKNYLHTDINNFLTLSCKSRSYHSPYLLSQT